MKLNRDLLKSLFVYQNLRKFYLYGDCGNRKTFDILTSVLSIDLEFFRYNKILVAVAKFMDECYSYTNHILTQRMHRYSAYYEETKKIFREFDKEGLKAVCIKSFGSTHKDIGDIDILLQDRESLRAAEAILAKLGYKNRFQGSEEHQWSIIKDGVIIDIDLHTEIAASKFIYYPKDKLFRRVEKRDDIYVPSPVDFLLILVAHALIKDLYLTLADVLEFEVSVKKHKLDLNYLLDEAAHYGLKLPLKAFAHMTRLLNVDIYEGLTPSRFLSSNINKYPLRPGIHVVLSSYLELTITKLKHEGAKKVLQQVMSLPSGKGIALLIRYLFGVKPEVKALNE